MHDQDFLPQAVDGGVRFRFRADANVASVAVAGTFNSWIGDSYPLALDGNGHWQADVPVTTGRHLYKYVVDGRDWIRDPANGWISEDGQNNSCITLDETGALLLRDAAISKEAPGPLYLRHAALASPDWLVDGVVYQLSARAFGGDLAGTTARLGELSELGVTVLWLMPIQPIGRLRRNGSLGDPYAVRDFDTIDPALGDARALRALVDAAHARGMRVIFDWTLNRCAADNGLVEAHPDWFTRDAHGQVYYAVPNRDCFAGFDFASRALRDHLIASMRRWLGEFGFDGLRLDDSDITPLDFLREIRAALLPSHPQLALISQAYDEFHHIDSCDLTYEGATREAILQVARGQATTGDFARQWQAATYSFPRGALRMRWLEDKEQGRAHRLYGEALHLAAATILLTFDGVPHILMGQEFNEPGWDTWTCLFEPFALDRTAFDGATFAHYRALIALRTRHPGLRRGELAFVEGLAEGLVAYWRTTPTERLLVLVNLSEHALALPDCARALAPLYRHGGEAGADLPSYGGIVLRDATHGH